ncbi:MULTISPECIES: ParB N-terminal domain-containing protein [unclassified Curtobacterium]|uniref:ParB N-terminal domain-containing protein n=1 Tax=unclassified Curtobacterium TaxID=257496 RepID=UPI0037F1AF7B
MMHFQQDFPLSQIIPREHRTRLRTNETERVLSESIQRFGWVQPLTLDAQYRIVDGQYRYELAKKWKLESVPVIISNGVSKRSGTTDLFHMLAGRIIEWDKWDYPATATILKSLDGGLGVDHSLGVPAVDESGSLRELARIVGWFVEVIPTTLTASSATMETLTDLLVKNLGQKYHYDPAQLLYIEALREQILDTRIEMVTEGHPDADGKFKEKLRKHLTDEESAVATGKALAAATGMELQTDDETGLSQFSIDAEVNYLVRKQRENIEDIRAAQSGETPARPTRVPRFSFVAFATQASSYTREEAEAFYDSSDDAAIATEMSRLMDRLGQ